MNFMETKILNFTFRVTKCIVKYFGLDTARFNREDKIEIVKFVQENFALQSFATICRSLVSGDLTRIKMV